MYFVPARHRAFCYSPVVFCCYFGVFFLWILLNFTGGDTEEENGGIVKGDIIAENGGRV